MSGVGSPPTVIFFFWREHLSCLCIVRTPKMKHKFFIVSELHEVFPTNRNSEGVSLRSLAFLIGENICMHTTMQEHTVESRVESGRKGRVFGNGVYIVFTLAILIDVRYKYMQRSEVLREVKSPP